MFAFAELESGELASLEFGDPVEPVIPVETRVREAVADLEARKVELWDVGALEAVPVLVRMLNEASDVPQRLIPVFRAIAFLRIADAAPIFGQYLRHADRGVQLETLRGLGKLGHLEAREPLAMYLSHEDRDFRRAAIVAVGKYPDAPLDLIDRAAGADPDLQRLAREGRRRREAFEARDLRALVDAIIESDEYEDLMPLMEIARDQLAEILRNAERSVILRRRCAWLLGTMRVARVDEAIVAVLVRREREPMELRIDVVWAAGRCQVRDAVDSLLELLDDPARELQRGAIASLGQIKDTRALEPILSRWDARAGRLRATALLAVSRMCERDGSFLLSELLRAGGSFSPPWLYLVDDSLRLSRNYRRDWIVGRLGSSSSEARRDAILLLAFFGERADADALTDTSLEDPTETNRGLAALGARRVRERTP